MKFQLENRSSNHNERKKQATTQIGQSKREKSTRGDGICVGNLISALPRLLGLAAAHAAVVEQHAEVQMVQEASQPCPGSKTTAKGWARLLQYA